MSQETTEETSPRFPADLVGKTAFVTGASSGLGRRFAITLARAGVRVAIAARRTELLEDLCQEIEVFDGRALPIGLDVTEVASIDQAVDEAETELGCLDILVNNAGIALQASALDTEAADFDRVFDVNVRGVYFVAQAAARRMMAHGRGGSIVNVASVAADRAVAGLSVYCASKAAVVHMSKVQALEWARHGIRVNALCPGYIETEINRDFMRSPAGERMIQGFLRRRLGEPSHLDGALLLLASQSGDYITGSALTVDDGQGLSL